MRQFLLFRLYGPLAAWGDVAVGETRPTADHPSKSAVLGLIAAAMGIRRDEEEKLGRLQTDFGFGVRVDAHGELLRDYHTAQVPPEKRKVKYYTRRDEIKSDGLYTILSSRDYRTDSCYSVVMWSKGADSIYPLAQIEQALRQPQLPLYLGRKSCPISLPLNPKLSEAESLKAAFDGYSVDPENWIAPLLGKHQILNYYWELLNEDEAGLKASMRHSRRDQFSSRKRWQFGEREEFFASEQQRGQSQ